MLRVLFIHWNAGEAGERAQPLRRAGYVVEVLSDFGPDRLRPLLGRPPAAVIIDLSRNPSQGLGVATLLRQRRPTRSIPLVFINGEPKKTARVREILSDAVFTEWRGVRSAVRRAIQDPPRQPVVPDTMAAYAGAPLHQKLGIKRGSTVALIGAPEGFERTLGPLPEAVVLKRSARGRAEVVVLFSLTAAALERRFPAASRAVAEGGSIWLAWPKQASGMATDLTQASVRRFGLDAGFVDYKICAIDTTWSGLRFARRTSREDRS